MSLQSLPAAKLQVSSTTIGKIDELFEVHTRPSDMDEILLDATAFSAESEGVKELSSLVDIPAHELAGKWLLFHR